MTEKPASEGLAWRDFLSYEWLRSLTSAQLSDAIWGLVSNLASIVGGLAMFKVITSLVNASQYGEATLALGVVGLVNFLAINPLFTAHLREYFDYLRVGQGRAYLGQLGILLASAVALAILAYFCFAMLSWSRGVSIYLRLFFPALLLLSLQPLLTATVSLLEAHRRFRDMALVSVITKVGTVPLLILLLLGNISASKAIILAQAGIILPALFFLAREVRKTRKGAERLPQPQISSSLMTSLKAIGWPLFFANLAGWVFTTSDRYLLEHFRSFTDVGIYAANYGLWSVPYMILNAWLETVMRPRLYRAAADGDARRIHKIVGVRTLAGLGFGLIGTSLLWWIGQPLALFLLGTRYWYGKSLMLIIASAHILYVVGSSGIAKLVAEKQLVSLLRVTVVAAISNVGLNILLLPRYGILGAAWSTLGSYALWAILVYFVSLSRHDQLEIPRPLGV